MKINNINIGIEEYGDPMGTPVFYFHGFPGSRRDGELFDFDKIAKECEVRIIGIDRPGIGLSDFQLKRSLIDWPKTVQLIANKYNLKKFSILGVSGGGPYALACANSMPDRLNVVSVISGMGPFSYKESVNGNAMLIPKKNSIVRRLIAIGLKLGAKKNPNKLKENIIKTLPPKDFQYLSQSNKMGQLIDIFNECFRQGLKGYLQEAKIYRKDWGFNVSDINANICLWHGTEDNNVNIKLARRIASELSNCKTTFLDKEGHFSVIGNYFKDILNEIKTRTNKA